MERTIEFIREKDPEQQEFHQAVDEEVESVKSVLDRNFEYRQQGILERITEPERGLMFRVSWVDDDGQVHVNRGFRVEMNSLLGPYKGGLRFHASSNLESLSFSHLNRCLKTHLPLFNSHNLP